jgi:pSer/pThr/pTyr-binding forkhead associated (FHA) protein
LWEAVDEGAGFDEVLDAVIRDGLRDLAGFVLLSGVGSDGDARDVKLVIRGPGEAEFTTRDGPEGPDIEGGPGGPVAVSGDSGTAWVERHVAGVTQLRVRVADATGPAYTIETGLVRVSAVEQPPVATGRRAATPDAEAVAVPIEPPQPTPPEASTPPEPPPPPAKILPPDPLLEQPQPARILPPDPQLESEPPAPPAPPTGSEDTSTGRYGEPVAPEEVAPAPGAVARLLFSHGEVVDVDRAIVVGRAPDAGRFGSDRTRLVTVPSPHQEISSTHLEIRPGTGPDHGSAVVTDLGSTNGTVVAQPGLPAEDLRPGIAVSLVPGATIDLGEGVTIQVIRV